MNPTKQNNSGSVYKTHVWYKEVHVVQYLQTLDTLTEPSLSQ